MEPAKYIKRILVDNISELTGLSAEHIHALYIPGTDKTTTEPILVVSEIPDDSADYGNDTPVVKYKRVQIDFRYPKNFMKDMEAIEDSVESLLLSQRVNCFSNAGHILSPDSQNIVNTLKFNYTKEEI
ncbi:MAG: hypothetical protein ABF624_00125 [Liquorilactobacillus ghanensis]|uniref:hypothetical protein n=1 Tax=Liquorilactobacillus ghanensis TaxID=399370 RepID=UPI0039EB6F48